LPERVLLSRANRSSTTPSPLEEKSVPDQSGVIAAARILIVEDEFILAKDLGRALKNLGCEIVGRASSAEEAIRIVEESKPDLVLMDIELAGEMDGIDAANEIRSRLGAAVIYLTAHQEKDLLDRAKLTAPHAYLIKPVARHQLERTVEMALYRSKMEKKLQESEIRYRSLYFCYERRRGVT
jgi:two-component SAPR family response regulator